MHLCKEMNVLFWIWLSKSIYAFQIMPPMPTCHQTFQDGKLSRFRVQSSASSDEDSSSQPIVALNVILRIKPQVREEFLEVILNNQRGTMNKDLEPLALEYSFGEDANEPNTFHFHEKYIGEEGIAAHNAAPHFLVWEEFAGTDPFTAPPEVYKFVIHRE
jgi:quinol monooxygenase YgiN